MRAIAFLPLLATSTAAAKVTETFHLTWEHVAPNGQSREGILINGQLPGPELIFNEGDEVEITVYNDMPSQNTSIHWHGLEQKGTPWSDGVPGITQGPIRPGEVFVYRFTASPADTSFYHAHSRMQMFDGLYGGLYVRPKEIETGPWSSISSDERDVEAMTEAARHPQLVTVSDWSQYTSDEYWNASLQSELLIFCVDSILVNGEGAVYCPDPKYLENQTQPGIIESAFPNGEHVTDKGCFPFTAAIQGDWVNRSHPELLPNHMQSGCVPSMGSNASVEVWADDLWVSLNFIGAVTEKQLLISLDEHPMWVYELDGHWVEPKEYLSGVISPGERLSAMVRLDKPPKRYTMRFPDAGATQVISGFAELVYQDAELPCEESLPYVTYGGWNATPEAGIQTYTSWNLSSDIGVMLPFPAETPRPGAADEEYLLIVGRLKSSHSYTMNATYSFPADFHADKPLLLYPNSTLAEEEQAVIRTRNGSWVDLIVQVSTLNTDLAAFTHVMHKHGSKTWRVGMGHGTWNYSSVADAMAKQPQSFNVENPGYRDTWLTQFSPVPLGGWWIVLRYQVKNPGPWLFHCHFESHVMGGMAMVILDGVDEWPEVPAEYQ